MAVSTFNAHDHALHEKHQTREDGNAAHEGDAGDILKELLFNALCGVDSKAWEIEGVELANTPAKLMRHVKASQKRNAEKGQTKDPEV